MKLKAVSLTNNEEQFKEVLNLLLNKFKSINFIEFDEYVNDKNIHLYYWLKSYRSNLTEGNTTTDEAFTNIIYNTDENILYSDSYDEQFEIINLKTAYTLFSSNKLDINTIQAVNRVLGNKVFKNRFIDYRGRFRKQRVFIPFNKNNTNYEVEFTNVENIKVELERLITMYTEVNKKSNEIIFSLCVILHNELIGIHPFVDGNGRTTRVIMEMELEKSNIFPFIPYEYEKREYQQAMSKFSLDAQESLLLAYDNFGDYILKCYADNVKKVLFKLKKMERLKEL